VVDLSGKKLYEKLVLCEYLALTIKIKLFGENKKQSALYLISKNIWSMHYIVLSYVLFKFINLIYKIK